MNIDILNSNKNNKLVFWMTHKYSKGSLIFIYNKKYINKKNKI